MCAYTLEKIAKTSLTITNNVCINYILYDNNNYTVKRKHTSTLFSLVQNRFWIISEVK